MRSRARPGARQDEISASATALERGKGKMGDSPWFVASTQAQVGLPQTVRVTLPLHADAVQGESSARHASTLPVSEWSCREAAGGIPESAREPSPVYTQLGVWARQLTRTSPRGGSRVGNPPSLLAHSVPRSGLAPSAV
jgi:hypothetical protein